jgi:BCS1 N terminal
MESSDKIFRKVLKFLTEKGYLKHSMSQMKVQIKPKEQKWWWMPSSAKDLTAKPEVEYLPGGGNHIFTYEGTKMWASQVEGPTLSTGYERKPTRTETLYITCYGQNTTPLKNLVQASIDYSEEKETEMMKIYQVDRWGESWEECQQKKPRSLDSVVLEGNIAQDIIADIKRF